MCFLFKAVDYHLHRRPNSRPTMTELSNSSPLFTVLFHSPFFDIYLTRFLPPFPFLWRMSIFSYANLEWLLRLKLLSLVVYVLVAPLPRCFNLFGE